MTLPTKTEAIQNFLNAKARPEFSKLYNSSMEAQVNVAAGNGERIDKEFKGVKYMVWTDGMDEWKDFRIPRHANTEPEYEDHPMSYDLAKHVEGIGLTGWDWENRQSLWLAYDFDAIVGHSDNHTAKLTDSEISGVRRAAQEIPWVTTIRSTSGNGLHLYVFLDPVRTENHNEHAALARAVLSKMSAITGFDFDSKVDNCGHVMWVWHRKFEKAGGIEGEGLKVIKHGIPLSEPPVNWKDHIRVSKGKRSRTVPGFVEEREIDTFEQMCSQHPRISLDPNHKALIAFLEESGTYDWWFDADHHMMVCHTLDLKAAHNKLNLKGIFDTTSSGGSDQNCFAFPLRHGAWVIRRHTQGVQETDTWDQDSSGWTRCYFNRDPDLKIAAKANLGAEDENGSFAFLDAGAALETLKTLGSTLTLNEAYLKREASLKPMKDGRLLFEISRNEDDNEVHFRGWVNKKKTWRKVINSQLPSKYEQEVGNYDDIVRHLISDSNEDAGWTLKSEDAWGDEPLQHMKLALKAMGNSAKDCELILGQAVMRPWYLTTAPFQPEYLGGRRWNRDSPQLSYNPTEDIDSLRYPTWTSLLNHCGKNITHSLINSPWAKAHGIKTGGEYLMLWIASILQYPTEPLPYLFFYGDQGTGKSIFHEAFSLLVTKGVVRADASLISQSGFNGELLNAIMCVVEETDLSQNRTTAYNRIKDWITSKTLSIHIKGSTPFTTTNTTHWVQCSNESKAVPIFPGDTRITMVHVEHISRDHFMPKNQLLDLLQKEAPDFLARVLDLKIPPSPERLRIPALESEEKDRASELNLSELELFIKENCYHVSGEYILISDFHDALQNWLPPERRHLWSKQKIGRNLPDWVIKGRIPAEASKHGYGNISFEPQDPDVAPKPVLVVQGDKIVSE